jgi:hypothetical protein
MRMAGISRSGVYQVAMLHALYYMSPRRGLSVSAAHIRRFPPRDALFEHSDTPAVPFSPEAWAAIQPPPPTALSAFANRIGLPDSPSIPRACTHPSFLALFRQHRPTEPLPATNAHLSALGNSLMGLFATEHLHAAYPYLPTRVLKAAVTAYVGPLPCATVAQEIGAAPLLRWHRVVRPLFFFSIYFPTISSIAASLANASSRAPHRRPLFYFPFPHCLGLQGAFPSRCPQVCPLLLPFSSNRPSRNGQVFKSKKSTSSNGEKIRPRTTKISVCTQPVPFSSLTILAACSQRPVDFQTLPCTSLAYIRVLTSSAKVSVPLLKWRNIGSD